MKRMKKSFSRQCPRCEHPEMISVSSGWECPKCDYFEATSCPECPPCTGVPGLDALCDKHYSEYLGTHCGGRAEEEDF